MKKRYIILGVAGLFGLGAVVYFLSKKTGDTDTGVKATLTITNPQSSYSISQNEGVLATLTIVGTPNFEVQYWINGNLFTTGVGWIVKEAKFRFGMADPSWGFHIGSNSVYFVVKDANGKVATSNTISFTVIV